MSQTIEAIYENGIFRPLSPVNLPVGATTQLAGFEQFCQAHRILPFSHPAAVLAADIWANLKRRGLLIGEVDILIAGIALSEGLAVATHNVSHFARINNLRVVDWTV